MNTTEASMTADKFKNFINHLSEFRPGLEVDRLFNNSSGTEQNRIKGRIIVCLIQKDIRGTTGMCVDVLERYNRSI